MAQAAKAAERMRKGVFDLEDLSQQLAQKMAEVAERKLVWKPAHPRLIALNEDVANIQAELATRGTSPEAFARAWRATFAALERVNRILLAPPP